MRVLDWRAIDPAIVQACYEREAEAWRRELWWETVEGWQEVERARQAGRLPGFVALDSSGDVRGWTFFHLAGDVAQVGGLVADDVDATQALLDAVIAGAASGGASRLTMFLPLHAAGLRDGLVRGGHVTTDYAYLTRNVCTRGRDRGADPALHPEETKPWRADAIHEAAHLLAVAYETREARHFTPHGHVEEWRHYVEGLVSYRGCGRLCATATRIRSTAGDIDGLALVTAISGDTAHLAQLAVHPRRRGAGVGGQLLADACAAAADAGYRRMTLLVSSTNTAAMRLYRRHGFVRASSFIVATRAVRPSRATETPRHGESFGIEARAVAPDGALRPSQQSCVTTDTPRH